MKNRERRNRIRAIWRETFADVDPADETKRAVRVRSLCPCESTWTDPLWGIIFSATEDLSPLVRVEALHVIEDAHTHGFATDGGMALLYAARRDAAPEVRRFASDVLRQKPKLQRRRNRGRELLLQKLARSEHVEDGAVD